MPVFATRNRKPGYAMALAKPRLHLYKKTLRRISPQGWYKRMTNSSRKMGARNKLADFS